MSDAPNRDLRSHALKAPGMPCPNCNTPIVIDPMILLSATPIECAVCGLELKVNTEKSANTLNALSAYLGAFTQVKTDFENKVDEVTAQPSERGDSKRRGRRAPKRRPRRGR